MKVITLILFKVIYLNVSDVFTIATTTRKTASAKYTAKEKWGFFSLPEALKIHRITVYEHQSTKKCVCKVGRIVQ